MSTRNRILVVDDEPGVRALLQDYLTQHGYSVRTASGGAELDLSLRREPADLIVLDLNMPGENGLAVASRLRQAGDQAGIVMLTAASEREPRLQGYQAGIDDYLVKPFELRELLARIRSVLRRLGPLPARPAPRRDKVGDHWLDQDSRQLLDRHGQMIALTPREFDLLVKLVRHPRQVLSREQLAADDAEAAGRSVDLRIMRLRRKIESQPDTPRLVKTVAGLGYLFDPDGAA